MHPRWWNTMLRQLCALLVLPRGWDGYQGMPVTVDHVLCALHLLETCCGADDPAPQVVPGARGDLQLEWHGPRGDIELHLVAPAQVKAWYQNVTHGEEIELMLTTDFAVVAAWLAQLREPPHA